MPPLRVGVVGAGGMSHAHLQAWQRLGVPAQVFSTGIRGPAVAARYGIPLSPDLDTLIAASDIVDVCTPTATHPQIVLAAAAAGRNVVCEKPLALTHTEAAGMIDACAGAGVGLCVGQVVRYFPAYAAARDAVAADRIGPPQQLQLTRRVAVPGSSWFTDEAASGGTIVDLMIHDIDYARWVAGDVVGVRARQTAGPGGTVTAEAELRHAGGAVSRLTAAWDAPGAGLSTGFRIAGPGGELRYDSTSGTAPGWTAGDGPVQPLALPGTGEQFDSPFDAQLADFVAFFDGGRQPRVSAAESLAALDIALAARESARTGRPTATLSR